VRANGKMGKGRKGDSLKKNVKKAIKKIEKK
jgi:hypothetical protein